MKPNAQAAIDGIDEALEAHIREHSADSEWLERVYNRRVEQFLSDNGRIWSTGAILIPLALAPLGVYASITSPDWLQTLVLALISVAIYIFWMTIAQNHRAYQQMSIAWVDRIEAKVGLEALISEGGTKKGLPGFVWVTPSRS